MRRAPKVALTLATSALFALVTADARADKRSKITDVCARCIASVPESPEPAPLLVALHGDWGQMAPELYAAWERLAAPRGVALLSLACPTRLGCKASYWQWNGDPAWIDEQIARLAEHHAIDRERMWLVGWSGGASYIGLRTQELERTFAALVIHGGGMAPQRSGCAPIGAPVVFLVGDQNPLHGLALRLRAHYDACGNEVAFMLLPGAEHVAEWKALDQRGAEIMELLATKKRHIETPEPPPRPAVTAPVAVAAPSASPPTPRPTPVAPRSGCGCEVPGGPALGAKTSLALLAALLTLLRSRTRGRRARDASSTRY